MRLVLRRVRSARSLLLAAVVATLIAVTFVVGLLAYGRQVAASASQATIASAPPDERALVVRGPANAGGTDVAAKDSALRAALAEGIGGRAVAIAAAGYSSGRAFAGPVGDAVGDDDGAVYANVMFLDDLPRYARLVEGQWARPGEALTEATLPVAAAAVLQIAVGDRVPIVDQTSDETTEVVITGIWELTEPADPHWLLAPGAASGVGPGSHTYGPVVLDQADFLRSWTNNASVAWVIRPDLIGAGPRELVELAAALPALDELPTTAGLVSSGWVSGSGDVTTNLNRLSDRLVRADLVGRSALLTPVMLIVVLGVYALLLIALLLTEQRRGETALIRARGGGRVQIAGFAVGESALVVLPAVVLAPALSALVLGAVGRLPVFADVGMGLSHRTDLAMWGGAAAGAVVCVAAMVGPSIRRSGTYIEELGARSRPSRFAFAQRVGVDVALVAVAALAWFQLRQYSSPLVGAGATLGIDPLLVAAPTIGVLAGAVLSLRLLPQVTRRAERWLDRKRWPAAMFGVWQAGRRPHAGPLLLVALAVAVSTLAWSLQSTAQRSIVDQADFGVGADIRLGEARGFAPDGRTAQVAAIPGVAAVAPVARAELTLGPESTRTALVGIEPALAATVMRYRDDLGGGPEAFARVEAARPELPVLSLPEGAARIAGTVALGMGPELGDVEQAFPGLEITVTALLLAGDGHTIRLPLVTVGADGERQFDVALPPDPGLSLLRISVSAVALPAGRLDWSLTGVQTADATGAWSPFALNAIDWIITHTDGGPIDGAAAVPTRDDPNGLGGPWPADLRFGDHYPNFWLMPTSADELELPVLATSAARAAMRADVGMTTQIDISGVEVPVRVVGEVAAVPGTERSPAAIIADLPTLAVILGRARAPGQSIAENWVAVDAGGAGSAASTTTGSAQVAQQLALLGGVRVLDRVAQAEAAVREPYGTGGRAALFATGAGALLLAMIGVGVDIRATARRRVGEFAVLQTMGADSRLLARSVLAEQGFLAGLGVLVGLGVGVGVAATLAPALILTPAADRPEPVALISVPWLPVLGTAAVLFTAGMLISGVVAATLGRRLAIARLRIGDET